MIKFKIRESVVVIEEEWFDYTNLTDGETFPTPLTKCAKTIFNQNKTST